VLVKDGERLAGVFTERDVLNRITPDLKALDEPVSNYMTRSPATIRRQDSIAYALHQMDIGGYRHMVVVDRYGEPNGVLSVRDILRFLCVRFAEIRSERK
jgi:predicted transcriptional regulator